MKTIEECRTFWANIAKENGWYAEPFHIQVWFNANNEIEDSVSYDGLSHDIIIREGMTNE